MQKLANILTRIFLVMSLSVVSASLLITMLAGILYFFLGVSWKYHALFNQAVWLQNNENDDDFSCVRGGMVGDLGLRYLSQETTQKDVELLLGPFEKTTEYNGYSCLSYNLGMCSGLKFDYDSLEICFSHNGKIIDYYTIQH